MAAQVVKELKTVTYATPRIEEHRRRRRKQIKDSFQQVRTFCFCCCSVKVSLFKGRLGSQELLCVFLVVFEFNVISVYNRPKKTDCS